MGDHATGQSQPTPANGVRLRPLWELPQSVLGVCLLCALRRRGSVIGDQLRADGRRLVATRGVGVSLGAYVFWPDSGGGPRSPAARLVQAHELGHAAQSAHWGPLYLLVIGLPSVCRYVYDIIHWRVRRRAWGRYYDAWPEDDADHRGGIIRGPDGKRRLRHI